MRFAYTVGTPDAHGRLLAYQGDPAVGLPALREIGYTGVELFIRDPAAMDADRFARLIDECDLDVAQIGTGPVVNEDRLTFTAHDPEVRRAAVERMERLVDFAARFGTQINIGGLRGDVDARSPEDSWRWMEEGFARLCGYAAPKGVRIIVEPQNRSVINNLNGTRETLDWLESRQIPNLFLMLDVYHMDLEGESITDGLREGRDRCVHVHFADTDRRVPGTGKIDFPAIVRVLKDLRYDRYVTVEIAQQPDSLSAAKAALEYLQNLMKEC